MRILKLSSTKNTRMNKNWIASSSIGNFWMSWRFKFLLSILKKAKIIINNKKKIMDLGCGNGRNLCFVKNMLLQSTILGQKIMKKTIMIQKQPL
jgi:hypothetical protein